MTSFEINALVALERDTHFLSGDMLHQEDLFKMQKAICKMIASSAREKKIQDTLLLEVPYLFKVV